MLTIQYVANRKEGQKQVRQTYGRTADKADRQIYYIAGAGEKSEALAASPFVEKLIARGYEVLLLNLPSDEPMMAALGNFMWVAALGADNRLTSGG